MAITKPVVIPSWADAGDKFPPTNEEIAIGWPFSNDPPTRQRFNWLLNYLARSARYLTQRGIADYDSEETYGLYDKCTGSNGRTYRSLADNNIGNDPTTTPAKWEQWGHSVGELMEVDAIIGLNFKNIAGWGLSTSEILQVGNAGHWHSVNLPNTTLVLPTLASMVAAGRSCFLLKLLRVTLTRAGCFSPAAASSARCCGERRVCSSSAWASQPTNEPGESTSVSRSAM